MPADCHEVAGIIGKRKKNPVPFGRSFLLQNPQSCLVTMSGPMLVSLPEVHLSQREMRQPARLLEVNRLPQPLPGFILFSILLGNQSQNKDRLAAERLQFQGHPAERLGLLKPGGTHQNTAFEHQGLDQSRVVDNYLIEQLQGSIKIAVLSQ